jgi:hypothetical protein
MGGAVGSAEEDVDVRAERLRVDKQLAGGADVDAVALKRLNKVRPCSNS